MVEISIQPKGLSNVIARMDRRIMALQDWAPVGKRFVAELRKETRQAFDTTKSPKGDVWPKLKPSTIAKRKVKKAAPSARAATSLEAALALSLGAAGLKPLDDTGRLKKSIGYVATRGGFKFFAVGYLRPHMSGGGQNKLRPPKRNPTPFEKVGDRYQLIPRLALRLRELARQHVLLQRGR